MAKISKKGAGKTLYLKISVYRCGNADTAKNLTISCSDTDIEFKTTLSDEGLQKFKKEILSAYSRHILESPEIRVVRDN
jgi:hypothetical protein